MSMRQSPLWSVVRELARELEADGDADEHPDAASPRRRACAPREPLVGAGLPAACATCSSWADAEPAAVGERLASTRCRLGAACVTISVAWRKRSGSLQRLDGGVDLVRGVPAASHDDAP